MIQAKLSQLQRVGLRLILLAAFSSAVLTASAQLTPGDSAPIIPAPPPDKIVRNISITFTGAKTLDEARVRAQMSLREGEPFSDERVDQDIRALFATGAIEDVTIRTADAAGGVNVVVNIIGRGAVGTILFNGNTVFDDGRLRREIEVKVGDPVDEVKLASAQLKIRELYEKRGFPDVLISYSTQPDSREGFTTVVFNVAEGARGVIDAISFEGNTAIKSSKLRKAITSKKKTFWRLWGKAGKLDNEALQADIKAIE